MRALIKFSKLVCLFFLILFFSCKQKQLKPITELASIDLLRGELLLCGDGKFGDVDFGISCNYNTREAFDLALALLHSFEYKEAEKAFVKVIDTDPECAMAYWGVAMSMYHSLWSPPSIEELEKGAKLLKIAQELDKTDREQKYLDAIATYYRDWSILDHKNRSLLYEKKMEAIYNANNNDIEATVFYALALNSTADPTDKSFSNQLKAGEILENLFPKYPNHPGIAHYIIHNYDYPELAEKALPTARKYAEIAPASAHAQHMPSHIFTRLGLWDESIASNIKSAESAKCYAEESNMSGHWSQEIHAIDYLVYAYLQKGDNNNAFNQNDYLKTIYEVNPADIFAITYPFAAIPSRVALENKNWKMAAIVKPHLSKIDLDQFPWQNAIIHFTRALGHSHTGNIPLAEQEIDVLHSLHQKLIALNDPYKANQVLIQIKASQAWINLAKGDSKKALEQMKDAASMENATTKHPVTPGEVLPAQELLGDMYLALNIPSEALNAYEINLIGHPNRFNGVYGAAIAAKLTGNNQKAKEYFKQLIELTNGTNSDRPELKEAKAFVAKHQAI